MIFPVHEEHIQESIIYTPPGAMQFRTVDVQSLLLNKRNLHIIVENIRLAACGSAKCTIRKNGLAICTMYVASKHSTQVVFPSSIQIDDSIDSLEFEITNIEHLTHDIYLSYKITTYDP